MKRRSASGEGHNSPDDPPASGGMIVRERKPVNLEMPFGSLDSFVTPARRFYVRCHHPVPLIDVESWRLSIGGSVRMPLELSFRELTGMESRTVTVTMECAGNGRAFLDPQREGAQWEVGAVGNAEWTGVPLSLVLKLAGVLDSTLEVVLEGADEGEINVAPRPCGKTHFSRSLPLGKAMDDVLLAFRMNGEELSPEHGFPVRAIVPGWYGMAAVKWLTRIDATTEPFQGFYQTIDYTYWERSSAGPTLRPIQEMRVKAQIARPQFAEVVSAGKPYRVHGAAWTADAGIVRVEVSTDGGVVWDEARLLGDSLPNVWRLWEYSWAVPETPGRAVLMARATDSSGRVQPPDHNEDSGSYLVHHWLPIEVVIR